MSPVLRQLFFDGFFSISLIGGIYIFTMPIELLHGNNVISNTVVPIILVLCLSFWLYQFYRFTSGKRPERLRFAWFVSFLFFNYLAAVVYYVLYGRSR